MITDLRDRHRERKHFARAAFVRTTGVSVIPSTLQRLHGFGYNGIVRIHLSTWLVLKLEGSVHSVPRDVTLPSLDTYSPLEMEQAIRDREEWILSGSIEAPDVLAVANKWRHWKPGKIKTQLPTSQRALEQHLRARWLERLLGYFIPFRHQIPYMHQVMGARELEEFGHLFGDARFRTIRAHCLAYEGMRKIGFQNLPWTAGDVRHLMNQAVTLEVTPAKLQKWWGTLKWLSIKLGMLNVDEHKQLLAKRKAIQETLVDTQVKPQRKAVVPTRAIVWALEQGAEGAPSESQVPELTKAVDRYIMAMARFNLACSARFNDVQHTSPQTVKSTSNTLELLAWQTKTTSAVAIKRNPVPLIAPLFSFSGARWWIPLEKWWKRFRASEEFREMDYLIPTINKDRTGFIPRPGTPDRSLRWLKDALGKQGAPAKDVAELSWYSFRVFMPDCAFQAHIPRDQRQYLGNWFKKSTADPGEATRGVLHLGPGSPEAPVHATRGRKGGPSRPRT